MTGGVWRIRALKKQLQPGREMTSSGKASIQAGYCSGWGKRGRRTLVISDWKEYRNVGNGTMVLLEKGEPM